MKRVIINADDFGFSEHTVEWTIKGFEHGVLSSATIMVGSPAVKRAVQYANQNPQWSFGLHLVLTDERPICEPAKISSMVTAEGLLWPTKVFMVRSACGLIRSEDLEREIRAQVMRLRELGVHMSHLDGHGHIHRMPFVLKSLIRLADELKITRLRPAQDLYHSQPRFPVGKWLNRWVNRPLKKKFKTPDHFLMTSGKVDASQAEWFRLAIERLPPGCSEIGIHPGTDEAWRRLDTMFILQHGKSVMEEANVRLISYLDVN